MQKILYSTCVCLALAVAANGSLAAEGHGDIALFDDGGKIGVGLVDDSVEPEIFEPGVRVFESILIPALAFSPFDFDSDEPGFDIEDGQFPPSQQVDLVPLSLEYWDGTGEVAFGPPAADVTFDFDDAAFATDDEGGLHDHALFGLESTGAIPDGVYVGQFLATTAGLEASDPIYLVMLKDDLITAGNLEELEELLEAYEEGGAEPVFGGKSFAFFEEAVEAVEARVAIPEPSAVGLTCVALGSLLARRRRHGLN
jgi:hypothetical protein